nr:hypothetical protein [uncultured Duganella sp.]
MSNDPHHPVHDHLFRPGRLSLGLVMPLTDVAHPRIDQPAQFGHAALADELGFDALWDRDVPLNSTNY